MACCRTDGGNPSSPGFREASLVHNASASFIDTWVAIRFEAASRCLWTRGASGQVLPPRDLPIRHGEGRFVTASPAVLAALESEGLVALRYGEGSANPNGSEADIAGICDPTGRVLGLMPHPEAFLVPENGPGRRRSSRPPPRPRSLRGGRRRRAGRPLVRETCIEGDPEGRIA